MTGSKPLQDMLSKLADVLSRPAEVFRQVVYPIRLKQFQQAFDTAGRSTGKMWAPLEPRYAALQASGGDSLVPLETSSARSILEPSFQGGAFHVANYGSNSLSIGSSVPWAAHVANGGTNSITGEQFEGRDPTILSRSQKAELTQALATAITKGIK